MTSASAAFWAVGEDWEANGKDPTAPIAPEARQNAEEERGRCRGGAEARPWKEGGCQKAGLRTENTEGSGVL